MANGDRRLLQYLFDWQQYPWARSAQGVENSARVTSPTISQITGTTALVTVQMTGMAANHRVLYGARQKYSCSTGVGVQSTAGGSVSFRLKELKPQTTYYLTDVATPLGPFPAGGDLTGVPVTSAEVSFSTGVGALFEGDGSGDGNGFFEGMDNSTSTYRPGAPSGDGGQPVEVPA